MKSNYTILTAREFCDSETYADSTSWLLRKAYQQDPTVIPHTFEEMRERYEWSVVAVLDNTIVWQASKYGSRIPWYTTDEEIGSVVVDFRHWNMSIGNSLVKRLSLSQDYCKKIISATVNPRMYPIFEKNWFRQIKFPAEYLAEWEKHLAPKMIWGIEEFHKKARCYLKSSSLSHITPSWCFQWFD